MSILHMSIRVALAALALVSFAPSGAQRACGDAPERQRVTQDCTVLATGDIDLVHTVRLPLRAYNALKDQVRNTEMLLRQLGVEGQATLYRDARAEYDDAERAVRVRARIVGGMKNRGSVWHVPISSPATQEVLEQSDGLVRLLSISRLADGTDQVVTTTMHFPAGTKGVRFDAKAGRVEAELPVPPSKPRGKATLHLDLEARPEIMSCFYKLYGLHEFSTLWVARAAFRNDGEGAAREFGVRFRIVGRAEWSPWQRSAWLYPGQTAVEAYYPIFGPTVRELTTETPSRLELEWTCDGADGTTIHGEDSRGLSLLGMNDVVWSSMPTSEATTWAELFDQAPLVAATFVSHTDPVVQRFAGMAASVSHGAAAAADDASARRFLEAVYALIVGNRIAYQSPPGLLKENLRQHVKFARDVLRNRAGTCIDLSVLFASTCQAGGLSPYLVFVPGHAFPAVRLPSGNLLPIESTGISVGEDGHAVSFAEALAAGERNMDQALAQGAYLLCDIDALRAKGIPPPELPDLPGNPLEAWGITDKALAVGNETPKPPATPGLWQHPNGRFALAVPAGWTAQVADNGVNLAPVEPGLIASLRVRPRGTTGSVRSLAEESGLALVLESASAGETYAVIAHEEGTTSDKRHPRSSVQFRVTSEGKVLTEDYTFMLGREFAYALRLRTAKDAWARWLPVLRTLVASIVIHEPPAEPVARERFRAPNGRFEVEIPVGWKGGADADGDLRVERREGAGTILVSSAPRPDAVLRTADELADAQATAITQQAAERGGRVDVLTRRRALGGGAKIAISTVMLRTKGSDGTQRILEIHAFAAAKTNTTLLMEAPETLWGLWAPSFRQVWQSILIRDEPLPGADAPTATPTEKPAPKPDAAPTPPSKPPVKPEASGLDVYQDPAGLFAMPLPTGWKVEGTPMGVNATSPGGNALVSLTLGLRNGDDHDAFVTRVVGRMPTSFPGWKEQSRAVGGGDDVRVTRIEATTGVGGTPVFMLADLLTSARFHQLLLLVCPLAERDAHARLFEDILAKAGSVTGNWPAERPSMRVRAVATERLPYTLEVPTNWRVEPDALDLVATAPHGDALVVARAAPRTHDTIDAFAQAVLARMKARGGTAEVLSQEVREENGRSMLIARLRDQVGGVPWERELRAIQTPTHDLQIVLSCRVDLRFKWDAILGRIANSWKPR